MLNQWTVCGVHLGSLTDESAGPSAPTDRCLCGSCGLSPLSSGRTDFASARPGGFREGSAADCASLLGLVLSRASGICSVSGHLIPGGQEEVSQKCTQTPPWHDWPWTGSRRNYSIMLSLHDEAILELFFCFIEEQTQIGSLLLLITWGGFKMERKWITSYIFQKSFVHKLWAGTYRQLHDNNPASRPGCFELCAAASSVPCPQALLSSTVLTAPPAPPPLWPSGASPGCPPTPAIHHYLHGRIYEAEQQEAFSKMFYTMWLSEGVCRTCRSSGRNQRFSLFLYEKRKHLIIERIIYISMVNTVTADYNHNLLNIHCVTVCFHIDLCLPLP